MRIQLPENVNRIIQTLQRSGYEAYAVGGCVRDSILGRVPDDWDITTSAMPEETKKLFSRTFDTGIEHGTITVLMDKEAFEVTTYRIDGKYEDSRHPSEVTFTRSLREDLLRRDFTINAMAYNEAEGLVDIFGGMEDLKAGIIRCVGDAMARFSEDALRILRAIRFAAQLGFEIEEETKEGIQNLASNLTYISAERIQVELVKMLISPSPELMGLACELGITKEILPEVDGREEIFWHSLRDVRADKVLRLAMLLRDIPGSQEDRAETAKQILRRLKFDNDTLRMVTRLVFYYDLQLETTASCVRRGMNQMGEELFPYYLEMRKALVDSDREKEDLKSLQTIYGNVLRNQECVSLKTLAITGADLLEVGMQQGKAMGEMLQMLLDCVLDEPSLNEKNRLLQIARERLK